MKNLIKFWVFNRFSAIFISWIIGFVLTFFFNPYINGIIMFIMIFSTLFGISHIVEENKMNSSERLMWKKYNMFFNDVFNIK